MLLHNMSRQTRKRRAERCALYLQQPENFLPRWAFEYCRQARDLLRNQRALAQTRQAIAGLQTVKGYGIPA